MNPQVKGRPMRTPRRAVGSRATSYRGNGSWDWALSDDLRATDILPAVRHAPTPDRPAAAKPGGKNGGIHLPCPPPRRRIARRVVTALLLAAAVPVGWWVGFTILTMIITGGIHV